MSTVTSRLAGLNSSNAIKAPVRVATTAAVTLSGFQTIDGVTLADGDYNLRVLVKNQTDATQNGIWDVKAGAWTRTRDFDGNDFQKGTRVFVNDGATQWGMWIVASEDPIVIDEDAITFEAFASVDVNVALLDVNALTELTLVDDEADLDFIYDASAGVNKKFYTKNLGFTQTGTGALLRSLQGRLRDVYSVLDFIPEAEHAAIRAYTSTTDLRTYINNAIAAAALRFRDLHFPAGLYPISNFIGQNALRGVKLTGEGGRDLTYSGNSGTVIKFTGTGAGDIVTLTDHKGITVEDIQVVYTSNSFTGTFFNCATTFQTGCGSLFRRVQCYQIGNNGLTAGQCWYIKNNVDVTFDNCYASHAAHGWVGLFDSDATAPTNETNIIRMLHCTSIGLTGAAIVNPIIGWTLVGHNFEPTLGASPNAPSGILATGAHTITKLSLYDCTGADATANGTWVNLPVNVTNFTMIGGGFFGNGVATITGISIGNSSSANIIVKGARLADLTTGINFLAATTGAIVEGVNFTGTTTQISGRSNLDPGSRIAANNPDTGSSSHALHNTGLWIYDTDSSHVLKIIPNSNLTADRQLRLTPGDVDRNITLAGDLSFGGAFTTAAALSLTAIAQGDIWYGASSGVLASLTKDTNATRYISNTGSSNGPAWAQIDLASGVTGDLPFANLAQGSARAVLANATNATADFASLQSSAMGQILNSTASTIAWTATPVLGNAGTMVGTIGFQNATSGTITLSPVAGALGTVTLTMPAVTDTIAVLAASQAFTNKTYNGLAITSTTGTLSIANGKTLGLSNTLTLAAGADGNTYTFSSITGTIASLNTAQAWTNVQTFGDGNLVLNGASSGSTTIKAPATGGGIATFFGGSDTVVGVAASQELTNKTLNAAVAKGTWTASGTWTIPAVTLGGTVSGNSQNISNLGTIASTAHTITSSAASALAVGLNGATNPALQVDASTASQVAGLKITGAATGGTVAVAAIDSGSNANLTINAKGSGTIGIGSVSTGAVSITPALTLSNALTYGGVTLSNAVTGTGNMVLSVNPTFTNGLTGQSTGNPFSFRAPSGGDVAIVRYNTVNASEAVGFGFQDAGTTIWVLSKQTDNTWRLNDFANSVDAITATRGAASAGSVAVGYTTASTSTGTGSLRTGGGLGVGGAGFFGGEISTTGVASSRSGTATPAAASAVAGIRFGSAQVGIYWGTGDPNGALTAPKGSLYMRTDATTTTTRFWINTDAGTTWANFTSSA